MSMRFHVPIVGENDDFLYSPISDNRATQREQNDHVHNVKNPAWFEALLTVLLFLLGSSPALALFAFYVTR